MDKLDRIKLNIINLNNKYFGNENQISLLWNEENLNIHAPLNIEQPYLDQIRLSFVDLINVAYEKIEIIFRSMFKTFDHFLLDFDAYKDWPNPSISKAETNIDQDEIKKMARLWSIISNTVTKIHIILMRNDIYCEALVEYYKIITEILESLTYKTYIRIKENFAYIAEIKNQLEDSKIYLGDLNLTINDCYLFPESFGKDYNSSDVQDFISECFSIINKMIDEDIIAKEIALEDRLMLRQFKIFIVLTLVIFALIIVDVFSFYYNWSFVGSLILLCLVIIPLSTINIMTIILLTVDFYEKMRWFKYNFSEYYITTYDELIFKSPTYIVKIKSGKKFLYDRNRKIKLAEKIELLKSTLN
jgi:hypothetical protein